MQRWVSLGIVVAAVSVWTYLLLKSDNDPLALQKLVGCYDSPASVQPNRLVVLASGRLVFGDQNVWVSGYSDKAGDSLLPRRKLVVLPGRPILLRLKRGYPLLVRSDDEHRSLTVPSESGYEVVFTRRAC